MRVCRGLIFRFALPLYMLTSAASPSEEPSLLLHQQLLVGSQDSRVPSDVNCNDALEELRRGVAIFCSEHSEHSDNPLCSPVGRRQERGATEGAGSPAQRYFGDRHREGDAWRDQREGPSCHAGDGVGCVARASPLPVAGGNVCVVLRQMCGEGVTGQHCLKEQLVRLLASADEMAAVRKSMVIPAEFYFLCSEGQYVAAFGNVPQAGNTTRVQTLTALLRKATHAEQRGDPTVLRKYRQAARWSSLETWAPLERLHHFLDALTIHPDNLHCIDRLAVTLGEVADHGAGPKLSETAAAARTHARRSRALLLHYAVLRGIISSPLQRPLHLIKGLAATPVWYPAAQPATASFPARFAWTKVLEEPANVRVLQREVTRARRPTADPEDPATGYLGGDGKQQQEGIHRGRWSEVHLIQQGRAQEGAEARFPGTMAILQAAGVDFINARFSVLGEGTHITAHCGVSNAKLRGHLGLLVPADETATANADPPTLSGMRVGQQFVRWHPGSLVIFDDSFEHEVWWRWPAISESPRDPPSEAPRNERIVLIIDVFHPQLSAAEVKVLESSMSRDGP